ncbi:MAG: efflux RND transporter periplasmic adaptor subunit [Pseudomonadota bacterium]
MQRPRLTLALLALAALSGCSDNQGDPPPQASAKRERSAPVITEVVALETERVRLEAVGTSRARRSVTLHPLASGRVTAVNFSAGEHVEAGKILLELDSRDERLAVDLARVRRDEAERLYRRYQRSQKSITPSDLDSARSAVEAARIELSRARVALEDRTLEAPFSGHVGLNDTDPGAYIGPETAVTTLDDRSLLQVSFALPESLSDTVRVGDEVDITTWRHGAESISGRIVELDSRIDPTSRTVLARAEVANPEDRLRPGMSFRVTLVVEGAHYPVVPEVGVQWGSDGSYVWKVRDGQATRVPVTIVQRRKGRILVDAALKAGDRVVREGIQRMREGSAVNVINAEAATDS